MFRDIYDFLKDINDDKVFAATYGRYGAGFSRTLSDEDTMLIRDQLISRGYNTIIFTEVEDHSFVSAY